MSLSSYGEIEAGFLPSAALFFLGLPQELLEYQEGYASSVRRTWVWRCQQQASHSVGGLGPRQDVQEDS